MSQQQHTSYPPFCTYNCTYIPCSPYTHLEYHDTAHNTLLTQMCDKLTDSDNCLACLSVHHSTFPIINFALHLVLVDLLVHTYSMQSAINLQILSRAWSACLRSLRASRDFHLISTSFAPNTWLTASTSLCLLPYQFLLRWFLATFLCCCFCAFFGVSQCKMPVLASWCMVAPGSWMGSFLIL